MSQELFRMVKELEKRVQALESKPKVIETPPTETLVYEEAKGWTPKPPEGRGMCPKCGVKPNHFFHVKNCTGKEEKQDAGTDRPGSNTATR